MISVCLFFRASIKLELSFCLNYSTLTQSFCVSIFCSPDLGGVVFIKSRILTKSAFIGAGKNFFFEFHQHFSPELTLPGSNCSPYLFALERELDALPPENWLKCFPTDV
ncbi:hypothetical protein RCL1_000996 [Eukaryota sp. TZLM3-RCL]